MKNILNLIVILLTNSIFSQTIIPIEQRKNNVELDGQTYYYKDVNGVFNKFLGNWKYQDNATNLTKIVEITFYKREMVQSGVGGFYDEIYARIKYTENGVIIYNTFPENQPVLNKRDHNILGGYFTNPLNTNNLDLSYYSEPGLGGKTGTLELMYENVMGAEKLNWKVKTFRDPNNPFRMPYNMELIKQ